MKTKMKKILYSIIWVLYGFILFSGLSFAKVEVDIWDGWNIDNFWDWLTKSTASIDWRIDTNLSTWYKWETAWNIILKISSVVFSVLIVVGVLVAMVGLYQILTSSDESKIKTWTSTLIYWVIGIILMYSAQYLTKVIFNNLFNWWAGNEIKVQQLIDTRIHIYNINRWMNQEKIIRCDSTNNSMNANYFMSKTSCRSCLLKTKWSIKLTI